MKFFWSLLVVGRADELLDEYSRGLGRCEEVMTVADFYHYVAGQRRFAKWLRQNCDRCAQRG
jgi:hypothetical protein